MDWLPEDDIVHLIVDAVDMIDVSGFEATYKVGHATFAPAMGDDAVLGVAAADECGKQNRGMRAVHRHLEGPQAAGRTARGTGSAGADAAIHEAKARKMA
ncbi:MAG: hypothetical protein WAU59_07880 [Rhodoplanes sp.]